MRTSTFVLALVLLAPPSIAAADPLRSLRSALDEVAFPAALVVGDVQKKALFRVGIHRQDRQGRGANDKNDDADSPDGNQPTFRRSWIDKAFIDIEGFEYLLDQLLKFLPKLLDCQ